MQKAVLLALAVILLAASMVQAHAAPNPRPYETRILHDYSDDYFAGGAGGPGFDLIALDAREAFLNGEPALVLRIILNGGCPDSSLQCTNMDTAITFTANGTEHIVTVNTADAGATFQGNAAAYSAPTSINDGTRFGVDVWVPFQQLGIEAGSALTSWSVATEFGGVPNDSMVAGIVPGQPEQVGGETAFDIGTYFVRAPDYYVALDSALRSIKLAKHAAHNVTVTLSNLVQEEQDVQLLVMASEGLEAEMVDTPQIQLMAPNFTQDLTLRIGLHDASEGIVVLTAISALGGMASFEVDVSAAQPAASDGMFASPMIAPDSHWNHTFTAEGTFAFHNHHMMDHSGHIAVMAAGDAPEVHVVSYKDTGFEPHDLVIHAGDTVQFVNDASEHLMVMGALDDHGMEHPEETEDDGFLGLPAAPMPLLVLGLVGIYAVMRRR